MYGSVGEVVIMTKKKCWTFLSIFVAMVFFTPCEKAEATIVVFNPQMGYKVDIDDSTVRMIGRNHARVVITPFYDESWILDLT